MEAPEPNVLGPSLLGRFRGAVLGGVLADVLAFPYQHYSRAFLRSMAQPLCGELALHHSGHYPRGQYSDETQHMLAVLGSVLEEGAVSGAAIANEFAVLWRDRLVIEGEESTALAMKGYLKGKSSWREAGLPAGHAEAAPAGRVVPLGLLDHDDLEKLCEDVEIAISITHRDPRTLASAAAAAAAIAINLRTEELILGEFLDVVARAAGKFDQTLEEAISDFPRVLSMTEERALRHFESLCPDERYPPSPEGLGPYCLPTLCIAIYYFLKSPYSYETTVEHCLRSGGCIDTVAFLGGAISGALIGEAGLPANLISGIVNIAPIALQVDQLHNAWASKARVKR